MSGFSNVVIQGNYAIDDFFLADNKAINGAEVIC